MRTWLKIFVGCVEVRVVRVVVASGVALAACGGAAADVDRAASALQATSPLSVHDAWTRPTARGASGAIYFRLDNVGPVAETLAVARSDDAEEAGVHQSMETVGTMHMTAVSALPVPANDSVAFSPLGAHVMLTRLKHALVEGDSVKVMLEFRSGRTVAVHAGVRRP